VRKWFSDGVETYRNDKRSGFAPYRDLPNWTSQPLELALPIGLDDWPEEYEELRALGWRLRDSAELSEPSAYQEYVQSSLGEFSCAKPAYSRLGVAWISDRTLCYLASGKPAVVQHTGPSSFLPNAGGLFRFRDLAEAASQLDSAVANYEENCRLARALAEEHFDARKVLSRVLELSV
jgi:glycosyltransferase involved in cell wall biosynthesis